MVWNLRVASALWTKQNYSVVFEALELVKERTRVKFDPFNSLTHLIDYIEMVCSCPFWYRLVKVGRGQVKPNERRKWVMQSSCLCAKKIESCLKFSKEYRLHLLRTKHAWRCWSALIWLTVWINQSDSQMCHMSTVLHETQITLKCQYDPSLLWAIICSY